MHTPVTALLWQCWRLSRRWYVLLMAIAIVVTLRTMTLVPPNAPAGAQQFFREALAFRASLNSFVVAIFSTLVALSVSGRSGFPLRFEYRLPIDPKQLGAIPLLYLSVACASFYLVPALLSRLFFDVSMPLAAPAMLIAICVATLATASWSTSGPYARTLAVVAACFGLVQLFVWIQPLAPISPGELNGRRIGRNIIDLTALEYGLLVLLFLAQWVFIVHNLRRQRSNEPLLPAALFARKEATPNQLAQRSADEGAAAAVLPDKQGHTFVDHMGVVFDVLFPPRSAWSAELWSELKRYGIRILVLGVLLALSIPLFLLFGKFIGMDNRGNFAWMPVAAVFFVGIGISFVNRRQDSSGYMNAFEGTRSMGTLQLAGIHFLVAGITTLAGVLLTSVSLWLSLPLLDAPGVVIAKVQQILTVPGSSSAIAQAGELLAAVTLYITLIAFIACLHACSVFWGRKVLYGMMVFVLYCIFFTFNVVTGAAALEDLQQHMWAFAGAVLLLTLFILGRVVYMKTLSPGGGIKGLAAWGIFLLCASISLQSRGIQLTNQAPELLAFNAALLTLPFTLFLLTAWSYDRLRHH